MCSCLHSLCVYLPATCVYLYETYVYLYATCVYLYAAIVSVSQSGRLHVLQCANKQAWLYT